MDAELKEYLHRMFVAITDQIGRLDQRVERVVNGSPRSKSICWG